MTVLPELLPYSLEMAKVCWDTPAGTCRCCAAAIARSPRQPSPSAHAPPDPAAPAPIAQRKLTGIMNFTNPGAISHNEILQVCGMDLSWHGR